MAATTNNKAVLFAEIARTPQEHETGLMGRKSLPLHAGMLFDFGQEKELAFWMANTYLPLQIAFIKADGRIGEIKSMVPLSTRPIRSAGKYRYALEVNDGVLDAFNLRVNSQVALPQQNEQQPPGMPGIPPMMPGQTPQPPQGMQVQPKMSEMTQRHILQAAINQHVDLEITYEEDYSHQIVTKRVTPMEIKRAENGHKYMVAFDQKEPTPTGLRSFILGSRHILSINNPYSAQREQITNPAQVSVLKKQAPPQPEELFGRDWQEIMPPAGNKTIDTES